jgi:Tfp pilus assembly protein PilO
MTKNAFFKTYSAYILAGGSLLVLVLVTVTVLLPTVKTILVKRETLVAKKTELAALTVKRTVLAAFDTTYLPKLQAAELALPQEKEVAAIMISLENLSTQTGVGIESIDLSPGIVSTESASAAVSEPIDSAAQTLPISIRLTATHEQLVIFIESVQTVKRLFDIERLVVSPNADSDLLSGDLSLTAYYLTAPTEIGAVEEGLPQLTNNEKTQLSLIETFPNLSVYTANNLPVDLSNQPLGKTNLFTR